MCGCGLVWSILLHMLVARQHHHVVRSFVDGNDVEAGHAVHRQAIEQRAYWLATVAIATQRLCARMHNSKTTVFHAQRKNIHVESTSVGMCTRYDMCVWLLESCLFFFSRQLLVRTDCCVPVRNGRDFLEKVIF